MKTGNVRLLASMLAIFAASMWSTPSSADSALHKAGRGFAAITTAFLELPGNVMETSRREGPITGWTMGVAKGIGMTVVRPIVGVYEIASAPWAAPKNFEPILEPEYPWSYFGEGDHSSVAQRGRDYRLAKQREAKRDSNLAKR